jgi:hypothetical protein
VRGASCGLRESELVGGAGERPRRLGQQRQGAELEADKRCQGSSRGFAMHINCGGAEAPEQLLRYLDRRLGVSDHADSVYRSVNADRVV